MAGLENLALRMCITVAANDLDEKPVNQEVSWLLPLGKGKGGGKVARLWSDICSGYSKDVANDLQCRL